MSAEGLVIEKARQAAIALRLALHYTEAEYDEAGRDALIGCRIAEAELFDALKGLDAENRALDPDEVRARMGHNLDDEYKDELEDDLRIIRKANDDDEELGR